MIKKYMKNLLSKTKILFERDIIQENEAYLNLLSITFPIDWERDSLYFPYDQGDLTAIIENQRVAKVKFKNLSDQYRDSLSMLAQEIVPETRAGIVRKVMKNI